MYYIVISSVNQPQCIRNPKYHKKQLVRDVVNWQHDLRCISCHLCILNNLQNIY